MKSPDIEQNDTIEENFNKRRKKKYIMQKNKLIRSQVTSGHEKVKRHDEHVVLKSSK